jgi:hypothetical protein
LRHLLAFLPSFLLRVIAGLFAHSLPLGQKKFPLMIENCLAIWIDTAQAGKIALFVGGDYAMQHDPVAAFPKIVFEFYYKRQVGLTGENVSISPKFLHVHVTYFPMQKLLKMKLRMSSVVVAPVISSSARSVL